MEVLPCSGVHMPGESDCPQRSSGTAFVYQEEPNCPENGEQAKLADGQLIESSDNMQGPHIESQGEGKQTVCDLLANSDCQCIGASCSDCQVEDQKEYCGFHDFEDDVINGPCLTSENSLSIVDTIESESPNNSREGDLSFSEPKWLEGDGSVALWVKWRGKWQAGIRCSGLTGRRIENGKRLNSCTAVYNAKLAVGMLNIVDQFHFNALTETARDVKVWKGFAMEASRCNGYSDFGRMLIKLHIILQHYINANWLHHSSNSWVERCQSANSAESVELLKEFFVITEDMANTAIVELFDSILWNDVNTLWDGPVQPMLGSEWKTWKHDVMKWFLTSPSLSSSKGTQQQIADDSYQTNLQKHNSSQVEIKGSDHSITLETDPLFFKNQDTLSTLAAETCNKQEDVREVSLATDFPSNLTNKWNEIVVEAADSDFLHTKGMELTPINEMAVAKSVEPGSKNRQCIAYIESKGRQCVRWANDGDVYCCVHLSSRFLGSSSKAEKPVPVDTPMCEGTTVLGTRCKHRALPGSLFCKKHRPHAETEQISSLPQNILKRKHEENYTGSEDMFCKDLVLVDVEGPLQVDPVSSIAGDTLHGESNLSEKPVHSENDHSAMEALNCIGSPPYDNRNPCTEAPKRYCLYCERHLPSWLKRARMGKVE
ncbi:Histone-lysine N-methyltransferase SUVR5 [Sesbania bispinosa]|nr:Histone-lysine N-methyltransferase SUVR5 [Sesbania bispinosa]